MAMLLKMEADSAGTTSDIQHPTPNEAHRLALDGRPAPERREVVGRAARIDQAVVPLHDLLRRTTLQRREQDLPVGVLMGEKLGSHRRSKARGSEDVEVRDAGLGNHPMVPRIVGSCTLNSGQEICE